MQLEIITPKKVFEGDVFSVQLPGTDGKFKSSTIMLYHFHLNKRTGTSHRLIK